MNNKILARIVAVVMAVAMLGTVSFAATTDAFTAPAQATAAVKTVMAVASATASMPTTITDSAILDVQQLSADDPYPTTINYDADRFAAVSSARYIIVRFGDANGESYQDVVVDTQPAAQMPDAKFQALTVQYEWTDANTGTKYKNVVAAKFDIPLDATHSLGSYGIRFGKWSTDPENAEDDGTLDGDAREKKFEGNLGAKIVGGGTLSYTAIVVGAVGVSEVEAFGYASFEE